MLPQLSFQALAKLKAWKMLTCQCDPRILHEGNRLEPLEEFQQVLKRRWLGINRLNGFRIMTLKCLYKCLSKHQADVFSHRPILQRGRRMHWERRTHWWWMSDATKRLYSFIVLVIRCWRSDVSIWRSVPELQWRTLLDEGPYRLTINLIHWWSDRQLPGSHSLISYGLQNKPWFNFMYQHRFQEDHTQEVLLKWRAE